MSPRRTAPRNSLRVQAPRARREEAQYVRPEEPWRYIDTDDAHDFVEERLMARIGEFGGDLYQEVLSYFPGNRVLPAEGAWVTVLRPPHTTIETEFGDTYFAVPYHDGVYGWRDYRYSVSVATPDGEVRMFPNEYGVIPIDEIVRAWAEGEYDFALMAGVDEGEFADKLFYVQTRGLPLHVAFPMVLGAGVNAPIGWFRLRPAEPAVAVRKPRRVSAKRRTASGA